MPLLPQPSEEARIIHDRVVGPMPEIALTCPWCGRRECVRLADTDLELSSVARLEGTEITIRIDLQGRMTHQHDLDGKYLPPKEE